MSLTMSALCLRNSLCHPTSRYINRINNSKFKQAYRFLASLARPTTSQRKWEYNRLARTKRQYSWRKKPPSQLEAQVVVAFILCLPVLPFAISFYIGDDLGPPKHYRDLDNMPGFLQKHIVPPQCVAPKLRSQQYQKLLDRYDIRFLVLHPGKFNDDITVHLEQSNLQDRHDDYEALSYAWGNQNATRSIYTHDGIEIPVTENLHDALQQLRYSNVSRSLWVDSICIDQADIDERNHQVRMMGTIYAKAARVVIWLGKGSIQDQQAFRSLQELHNIAWQQKQRTSSAHISWRKAKGERVLKRVIACTVSGISQVAIGGVDNLGLKGFKLWDIDKLKWENVRDMLRRQWFHRLWIIQEVSHAQRAVVVCGQYELSWNILANALEYVIDHDLGLKYLDRAGQWACETVVTIQKLRERGFREPLFSVMLQNTYGGCSDPRDKIFAMMSISEGQDVYDWEISFDYTRNTDELYRRFAIWDITRNRKLRVLSCAPSVSQYEDLFPPLPTWIPDWTRIMDRDLLVRYNATSTFCAASSETSYAWFTHDRSILHIRGAIIDSIECVGSQPSCIKTTSLFEVDDHTMDDLTAMRSWLLECWNIARANRPMTKSTFDALWRTMLCDLDPTGSPAPKSYARYFMKYLNFSRQAPTVVRQLLEDPSPVHPRRYNTLHDLALQSGVFLHSLPDLLSVSTQDLSLQCHSFFNHDRNKNALIERSLKKWATSKRFSRTRDGRLARVPIHAMPHDLICILNGSEVPYVLRLQEDGTYLVVGECYVHGIMHGEAMSQPDYRQQVLSLR